MRYHLQRILTGEWLTRDLDLADGVTTRGLSQPGGITGFIDPELRDATGSDGLPLLEKWATAVYAEDDGQIRGAGIVTDVTYEGSRISLDAPGFTRYPHGIPFGGAYSWGTQVDPMDIYRDLWAHLQSFVDADLGVVVDNTKSPVRIGNNAEPYRLRWWETPDVGGEMDTLAGLTPFDYIEEHAWTSAAKTSVSHRVRLGYPRLGTRRDGLRFVQGENVTSWSGITVTGERFANAMRGIGKGEGATMAHTFIAKRDGRLRRPGVYVDKTASQARIERLAAQALDRRSAVTDVTDIQILDHPNARIAAISPGDDILLHLAEPAYGPLRLWVRVLSISEGADGYTAGLSTQRSSAFVYSVTGEEPL